MDESLRLTSDARVFLSRTILESSESSTCLDSLSFPVLRLHAVRTHGVVGARVLPLKGSWTQVTRVSVDVCHTRVSEGTVGGTGLRCRTVGHQTGSECDTGREDQ